MAKGRKVQGGRILSQGTVQSLHLDIPYDIQYSIIYGSESPAAIHGPVPPGTIHGLVPPGTIHGPEHPATRPAPEPPPMVDAHPDPPLCSQVLPPLGGYCNTLTIESCSRGVFILGV